MLFSYVDECREREFKWGEHDCCTFACDWVKLMGRGDPMEALRNRYGSEQEACEQLEAMEQYDLVGLADVLSEQKYEVIDKKRVMRGDVVLVGGLKFQGEFLHSLGICVGERVALVMGKGISYCPTRMIIRGWRI